MGEPHLYAGVINLDYTKTKSNAYTRILKALDKAGWEYVETSAMAYEGDIDGILEALEILARSASTGGTLSALTVQAQRIGKPRKTPGAGKPANAHRAVLRMPLPSER